MRFVAADRVEQVLEAALEPGGAAAPAVSGVERRAAAST
jgi:hypothetical protein